MLDLKMINVLFITLRRFINIPNFVWAIEFCLWTDLNVSINPFFGLCQVLKSIRKEDFCLNFWREVISLFTLFTCRVLFLSLLLFIKMFYLLSTSAFFKRLSIWINFHYVWNSLKATGIESHLMKARENNGKDVPHL